MRKLFRIHQFTRHPKTTTPLAVELERGPLQEIQAKEGIGATVDRSQRERIALSVMSVEDP